MQLATAPAHRAPWWHVATYAVFFLASLVNTLPVGWEIWLTIVCSILTVVAVLVRHRAPVLLPLVGLAFLTTGNMAVFALGLFSLTLRRRDVVTGVVAGAGAVGCAITVSLRFNEDGSGGPWIAAAALIVAFTGLYVGLPLAAGGYVAARRDLVVALEDKVRRVEAEREATVARAVAEEQERIAAEMHDSIGHKLALLSVQAGALELDPRVDPSVAERASHLGATARAASADLRALIGALGPSADGPLRSTQPGLDAVPALLEEARRSGAQLEVSGDLLAGLDARGGDEALDAATGRAIYRIVQEVLTNAARHAPMAAILITLDGSPGGEVRVCSENRLVRGTAAPGNGTGLPKLQERVRSLGGALEVTTTGDRFRLCARLPWR